MDVFAVIIRKQSGLGTRVFTSALLLLIAFMILVFSEAGRAPWFAFLLIGMGMALMLVWPHIELDFAGQRYRSYFVRLFAREADFKSLPKMDHLQVRDITYPGGRAGNSLPGSWGDTYSYEIFLMSVAHEKLVICERPSKATVRRIVRQLVQASGLPVRDVTRERILAHD